MNELQRLIEHLSYLNTEGADLRVRIADQAVDPEWQPAFTELDRFVHRIADLLQMLEQAFGTMSTKDALQVLQLKRLTEIIDGQNVDLQELTRNTEELALGVNRVAADTQEVAGVAGHMSDLGGASIQQIQGILAAFQGLDAQAQATRQMVDALAEQSRAAAGGLRAIQGVAGTSKLLALNAAIQAAHANDPAFAVVAQEMRTLADRTADLVKQIEGAVGQMEEAAQTAVGAMRSMSEESRQAGAEAGQAAGGLNQIQELLGTLSGSVQSIAAVSEEQAAGTESMTSAAQVLANKVAAAAQSLDLTRGQSISDTFEQAYIQLGRFRVGTENEAMRETLESMAVEVEEAVEQLLQKGVVSLHELWDTEYKEIKGADIARLSRLFNVDRVPPQGFTPPKYRTGYDERVDQPLNQIMDRYGKHGDMVFLTVLDPNGFCLAQPRFLFQDWTGIPEKDLQQNRIKRLVADPISLKACRVAIPQSLLGKSRITRHDLEQSGVLAQGKPAHRPFLLQTYALDTGAVVLAMAMPVYVRGQRWATVRIGYRPRG